MSDTYASAAGHEVLNVAMGRLIGRFFCISIGGNAKQWEIPLEEWRHAAWLASLLAYSPKAEHQNKALAFATLSYLCNPADKALGALCYTVQSRTGSLPASSLLRNVVAEDGELRVGLPPILEMELGFEHAASECVLPYGATFLGTRFQNDLCDHLCRHQLAVVTAPTSAGKSYVIRRYLEERMRKEDAFIGLVIVPSKALIAEVSQSLNYLVRDAGVAIWTSFPSAGQDAVGSRAIFVLTQERCLRLVENLRKEANLAFVFVDEIQKLEEAERGGLLEFVIQEIHSIWPSAQFVLAGPYLHDVLSLGRRILGNEMTSLETQASPVVQIVAAVRPVAGKKQLQVSLHLNGDRVSDATIDTDTALLTTWKASKTKCVTDAVRRFGGESSCIVYAHMRYLAEKWAMDLVRSYHGDGATAPVNDRVRELTDFLEEDISPEYSLVGALGHGVAYHHGCVPDYVRTEIQELFAQGHIRTLYCTSTLLEGVNLPAEKIFVASPKEGTVDMPGFDFKNLIGRAGRMREHLAGLVFCLETTDRWVEEKMQSGGDKDVVSGPEKAIRDNTEELLGRLRGRDNRDDRRLVSYTACLLRHRFLDGEAKLREYLSSKSVNSRLTEAIVAATNAGLEGIQIPQRLCRKNPTVDPVLQDRLFKQVVLEYKLWAITAHPWKSDDIPGDVERSLPYLEKQAFYWQFSDVVERLDRIFEIANEASSKHYNSYSLGQIVNAAVAWIQGDSYCAIIRNYIHRREDRIAVDAAVREVLELLSTDVCFVLAKYVKVLTDVLGFLLSSQEQDEYKFALMLPSMIENGCCEPRTLALMAHGVPRTTARILATEIPDVYATDPLAWLQQNPPLDVAPIHLRFLSRLGLWEA